MLEPMQSVETEETPGAGRFVEGAEGERNEMPGARAVAAGRGPVRIPSSLSVRSVGGSPRGTSCGSCARPPARRGRVRSRRCCVVRGCTRRT